MTATNRLAEAADLTATIEGHLSRIAAQGRADTHLTEAHASPNLLRAGLDPVAVHAEAHAEALAAARAERDAAEAEWQDAQREYGEGDGDEEAAECAICPPGACPGPQCPGRLATAR